MGSGRRVVFNIFGTVSEWLRSGLQNRVHRFNSGRCLHLKIHLDFHGLGLECMSIIF